MNIGCVLYFDEATQKEIKVLWQKLYDADICKEMIDTNSLPHISLGAFADAPLDEIAEKAKEYVREINMLEISLSSIGCFPGDGGIVYLAPKPTKELLELNEKFYQCFKDYDFSKHILYTPSFWVPHCTMTLGISKEKTLKGVDLLLREFKPIQATITSIGFVEFYPINYRHEKTIYISQLEA